MLRKTNTIRIALAKRQIQYCVHDTNKLIHWTRTQNNIK